MKAIDKIGVFISPGGNGRVDTPKMRCLAGVVEKKGIKYTLPDWSDVVSEPNSRVKLLMESRVWDFEYVVLVGSSLGGYVSAIAAERREVEGLFLLVPILSEKKGEINFPQPKSKESVIVHALDDEYTDSKMMIDFGRASEANLHFVPGGHSLEMHLDFVAREFESFLERIIQKYN